MSRHKIVFFGNFGSKNLGNEASLKAILFNLRAMMLETEYACVCSFPDVVSATHAIAGIPFRFPDIDLWKPENRVSRIARKVIFGVPSEFYQWWRAFRALKGTDALIIPGTGLLTDAFDHSRWGPHGLLKWSLMAKLRGCKLLFVSVGVGPITNRTTQRLVKLALGLADFRSYRDISSRDYLKSIGFVHTGDQVSPDLVFSLPRPATSCDRPVFSRRPIVGLGLMNFLSMYSTKGVSSATYQRYQDCLLTLAEWLLEHGYDIKLLIGDFADAVVDFRRRIAQRLKTGDGARIIDASRIRSVDELLVEFSNTDLVVATRFHNVVFALLNNKPTISISFHDKCTSLMNAVGLSEYCLTIDGLKSGDLIGKVLEMESNADKLRLSIGRRCEEFRAATAEQYGLILAKCSLQKTAVPV